MNAYQEPKYKAVNVYPDTEDEDGDVIPTIKIVNRQSGEAIPDDEPIFILRARDVNAIATLISYRDYIASGPEEHKRAVKKRIDQFRRFADAHPERMKTPDTVLTEDWYKL